MGDGYGAYGKARDSLPQLAVYEINARLGERIPVWYLVCRWTIKMWTFSEFMVALLDKLCSCWINKKDLDKGIRYETRSVLCDLYLLSLDRLENRRRI
jgi:hypothetical protein